MLQHIFLFCIIVIPTIGLFLVKNTIIKTMLSFLSFVGFFIAAVLLAMFFGVFFVGFHGFLVAFVLCGAAYIICMLFAWRPFAAKTRRITALGVAGVAILLAVLFVGLELYHG